MNNLDRIKPFYVIDVKVKTKYKTYLSNLCDITTSYISFQGVEIEEGSSIETYEDGMKILEEGQKADMFYPWSSIISINLKRLLKKE